MTRERAPIVRPTLVRCDPLKREFCNRNIIFVFLIAAVVEVFQVNLLFFLYLPILYGDGDWLEETVLVNACISMTNSLFLLFKNNRDSFSNKSEKQKIPCFPHFFFSLRLN